MEINITEAIMMLDLQNARRYSELSGGTVYAASNGNSIIWSDSRSQVEREGYWICQIYECGHIVSA